MLINKIVTFLKSPIGSFVVGCVFVLLNGSHESTVFVKNDEFYVGIASDPPSSSFKYEKREDETKEMFDIYFQNKEKQDLFTNKTNKKPNLTSYEGSLKDDKITFLKKKATARKMNIIERARKEIKKKTKSCFSKRARKRKSRLFFTKSKYYLSRGKVSE